jgi:monoamine oxidase
MLNSSYLKSPAYVSPKLQEPILDVDVVVVGAGLSGLRAATDVQAAGYSCVVLEAKDRVGGKTLSTTVEHGSGVLDLGAAWINDKAHDRMYALFKQFGLEPIVQKMQGDEVFRMSSGDVSYRTRWPGLPAVGQEQQAMFEKLGADMDTDSLSIDLHDSAANGHITDISLGEYFRATGADGFALGFWTAWIHDLTGTDPDDIGLVYWLDFVKSCGGIRSLLSDGPEGAQYMTNRHGTCVFREVLASSRTAKTKG